MKKNCNAKDFKADEPKRLTIDEIHKIHIEALEIQIETLKGMLEDAGLYPDSLQKSAESLHFLKVVR